MNGRAASLAAVSAAMLIATPAFLGGADANASAPAPIQQENAWTDDWTRVASVDGRDGIALTHVHNLLSLNGIGAFSMGSRAYGVKVENANADRAIQILIDDATKNPYLIIVGDERFDRATKPTTVQVNQESDEHGRIKTSPRNPYIERAVREVYELIKPRPGEQGSTALISMFVQRIKLAKRRYLDSKGHWNVGYDFTVEFESSAYPGVSDQITGCVWDEGKQCSLRGSGDITEIRKVEGEKIGD